MENKIVRKLEIKASVSRVWSAITDSQQFGEWFRVKLNGPFKVGERITGVITYPGYEGHKWEAIVQKIEPESLFAYTWPPTEDNTNTQEWTLVEFHLEKSETGTLLTITESGFEKIPTNRRETNFRDNSEGWSIQIKNVADYVTK